MQLIIAIVRDEDAGQVAEALKSNGHMLTRVNTTSGFLMMGNATLLIGVEDSQVDGVLDIIRANCHPRTEFAPPPLTERPRGFPPISPETVQEVEVSRAVVFVLDVKRCERL